MFRSSRFIAFCVAVILFTVMIFLTKYSPIEISGGISIITGIYITGKSYRGTETIK